MESNKNVAPDEVLGLSERSDKYEEKNASKKEIGKNTVAGIIFGLSGVSGIIAGLVTWRLQEKRNEKIFRELDSKNNPLLMKNRKVDGTILALKALAWGTLYAVGGCSVIFFAVWKILHTESVRDFMEKKKQKAKESSANERTEFENWKDFFNYLKEKYETEKEAKKV